MNRLHATRLPLHLLLMVGLFAACATAQEPKPSPAPALLLSPLAGQPIPVLPASYLIADEKVEALLAPDLRGRLAWADSLIGDVLQGRGPEVTWVLPDELRRVARRAPGTVTDPDRMGQAVLRSDGFKRIPDPLFSQLRSLAAMTNSRQVMVPAAIRLSTVEGGVRAEVVLVLADTRSGALLWRSTPVAVATTPRAALTAAIAHILPDFQ